MTKRASRSAARRTGRAPRSSRTTPFDRQSVVQRLAGRIVRLVEGCATVLTLMLISDAFFPLFLHWGPRDVVATPVTPMERVAYWLAYGFTALEVLVRPRQILRTAIRNPFVIGAVVIAALSVTWSVDADFTLRRSFALAMWTAFGLFLASRYDTRQLLQLLAIAFGLLALSSFATAIFIPDYGREIGFSDGAWKGVFVAKNTLGEMMLLSAAVLGVIASRAGRGRLPAVLGLMLSVALIALAKATAALLIVGVLVFTIPVVLTFRRNNAAAALVLCALLATGAAATVATAGREVVLSALGKDATLTGRTALWGAVIQRIEERPVLGYGYSAFWEETGKESERVRTAVGWDTPHSHNGLLDVALDLGILGVLNLLAAYMLAIRRAWRSLRSSVGIDGVWAMTFLVMLLLGNITESSISQSFVVWAVFVTVACMRWVAAPPARSIVAAEPETDDQDDLRGNDRERSIPVAK